MVVMAQSADKYFAHARQEIAPLLPDTANRILEIGCSSGATLGWLREEWPNAEFWGIDGHAPLEPLIRARAGHALIHDLERPLPNIGQFDLILALDVLEHLRKPEQVMADLAARLSPTGVIIISVPNVASYQIIAPLLLRRQFRYAEAGPMDRTHLRWFTEESARDLIRGAGLGETAGVMTGFTGGKRRLFDACTLGCFRHFLTVQYILRGERSAARPFRWQKDWPRVQPDTAEQKSAARFPPPRL